MVQYGDLDMDGLDPAYVPTTGTPFPGGACILGNLSISSKRLLQRGSNMDWCRCQEIVPDPTHNVTEFTAAMLATKMVSAFLGPAD
ncbi:MAG: hypothetical protein Ct9H90mP16_11930 [Candidatus Poseidoniales archaeon]|nr:MAG: hypothetical protein Ct9H90mP16_11930 [Candidatus Poseidoniales archaeon]